MILKALQQVKDVTGKAVEVRSAQFPAYAVIKAARREYPNHILYYNPKYKPYLKYLITHECEHVLRMWTVEAHQRLIPTTNTLILNTFVMSRQIPYLVMQSMLRQLTSLPTDIQIEKSLYTHHVELRAVQRETMKLQSKECTKLAPLPFMEVNAMNYAYLYATGRNLDMNLVKPYSQHPHVIHKGKALLTLEENLSDDHLGDIERINRWTRFFGLEGIIAWTPFENIPPDYYNLIT